MKSVVVIVPSGVRTHAETLISKINSEWAGAAITVPLLSGSEVAAYGAHFYDRGAFDAALQAAGSGAHSAEALAVLAKITLSFEDVPELNGYDAKGHFARAVASAGFSLQPDRLP